MRVYSLLFAANGLFYNIVIFYVMIIVYNVDNKTYYDITVASNIISMSILSK